MIYNIVLNSTNIISGTAINGFHSFDWTILPESKYKVTFSFMSGPQNLLNYPSIPSLFVDLGQNTIYTSSNNNVSGKTTHFIGMLYPNLISGNSYLSVNRETTSILYLLSRPNTPQFNVRILNNITGGPWLDINGATITNYVLNITFETIDE